MTRDQFEAEMPHIDTLFVKMVLAAELPPKVGYVEVDKEKFFEAYRGLGREGYDYTIKFRAEVINGHTIAYIN